MNVRHPNRHRYNAEMRRDKTLNPAKSVVSSVDSRRLGLLIVDFPSNDWIGRDMDAGISRLPGALCSMRGHFDPDDYSVVVKQRAPLPTPWKWEIYCAGKRLPIERSHDLFQSREKASLAGKEALTRLMGRLSRRG